MWGRLGLVRGVAGLRARSRNAFRGSPGWCRLAIVDLDR